MFFDNLKTLRVACGLKVTELSRVAGVGVSTISRIEKHDSSTEETLMKIINALNATATYKNNKIKAQSQIKSKSKFGAGASLK